MGEVGEGLVGRGVVCGVEGAAGRWWGLLEV